MGFRDATLRFYDYGVGGSVPSITRGVPIGLSGDWRKHDEVTMAVHDLEELRGGCSTRGAAPPAGSWSTLKDKALTCAGSEYRGDAGHFDNGAGCLAAAQKRGDVDYAVWRGDSTKDCYVCAITARVGSREQIKGLCATASVPVVNALDDWAHPMQMLADLQVMSEHLGVGPSGTMDGLAGVKLAFVGDIQNNVTYDLMRSGALMGMDVRIAGPTGFEWEIEPSVLEECASLTKEHGGTVTVLKEGLKVLQ